MQDKDFSQFLILWKTYASIINPTSIVNDDAAYLCFTELKDYEFGDIKTALSKLARRGIFALNIAYVIRELENCNPDEIRERANIAFNSVYNILSYPGTGYSYIFEDVAIDHTLSALGWDMEFLNSAKFDEVFSKKDFVTQYLISAQKAKSLKHLVLKGTCTADNHTKLVSADKTRYNNPVTWTLSEADKEAILLGNEESDNVVKRITAELPVIPRLPEEKKADTSVPAPIKDQMDVLKKTFDSFGV